MNTPTLTTPPVPHPTGAENGPQTIASGLRAGAKRPRRSEDAA